MANVLLILFCRNTKVWFYSGNPVVDGKQRKSREKERKYNNERVKEIESAICGFISVFSICVYLFVINESKYAVLWILTKIKKLNSSWCVPGSYLLVAVSYPWFVGVPICRALLEWKSFIIPGHEIYAIMVGAWIQIHNKS